MISIYIIGNCCWTLFNLNRISSECLLVTGNAAQAAPMFIFQGRDQPLQMNVLSFDVQVEKFYGSIGTPRAQEVSPVPQFESAVDFALSVARLNPSNPRWRHGMSDGVQLWWLLEVWSLNPEFLGLRRHRHCVSAQQMHSPSSEKSVKITFRVFLATALPSLLPTTSSTDIVGIAIVGTMRLCSKGIHGHSSWSQ